LATSGRRLVENLAQHAMAASSHRCASAPSAALSCCHSASDTVVFFQLAVQSGDSNGFSPCAQRFISDSP
jgi:hypothetical protein